jgi:hypothetical protein
VLEKFQGTLRREFYLSDGNSPVSSWQTPSFNLYTRYRHDEKHRNIPTGVCTTITPSVCVGGRHSRGNIKSVPTFLSGSKLPPHTLQRASDMLRLRLQTKGQPGSVHYPAYVTEFMLFIDDVSSTDITERPVSLEENDK